MDTEALRSLVVLGEEGTLRAAAARLGVSRARVRRRVDELEAALGRPLTSRGDDRITLTAAGRALAEGARLVLRDVDALAATAAAAEQEPVIGPIRVLAPDGIHLERLSEVLCAGLNAFPDAQVELCFVPDPAANFAAPADVFVHFGGPPVQGAFVTRVIFRLEERLFATRAYVNTHGLPSTLAELSQHRLLTWMHPGESARIWPLAGGGQLPVAPVLASPDIHLVRRMMLLGAGVARLPDGNYPDVGFDGEVVQLLDEHFGRELVVRVLVPSAIARTPRMKQVVELIESMTMPG
jgi:DNA-binding transcriptional LysR family regulator